MTEKWSGILSRMQQAGPTTRAGLSCIINVWKEVVPLR